MKLASESFNDGRYFVHFRRHSPAASLKLFNVGAFLSINIRFPQAFACGLIEAGSPQYGVVLKLDHFRRHSPAASLKHVVDLLGVYDLSDFRRHSPAASLKQGR